MIGLDLNIYCLKDEDLDKESIGIDVPLEDCVLRLFTFYNIDYISPDRSNPDLSLIASCGGEFVANEKYEVVKQKIEQLRVLRFN